MRTRIAVVVMAALLGLYLVFALRYGLVLIGVGTPVAIGLGIANSDGAAMDTPTAAEARQLAADLIRLADA